MSSSFFAAKFDPKTGAIADESVSEFAINQLNLGLIAQRMKNTDAAFASPDKYLKAREDLFDTAKKAVGKLYADTYKEYVEIFQDPNVASKAALEDANSLLQSKLRTMEFMYPSPGTRIAEDKLSKGLSAVNVAGEPVAKAPLPPKRRRRRQNKKK